MVSALFECPCPQKYQQRGWKKNTCLALQATLVYWQVIMYTIWNFTTCFFALIIINPSWIYSCLPLPQPKNTDYVSLDVFVCVSQVQLSFNTDTLCWTETPLKGSRLRSGWGVKPAHTHSWTGSSEVATGPVERTKNLVHPWTTAHVVQYSASNFFSPGETTLYFSFFSLPRPAVRVQSAATDSVEKKKSALNGTKVCVLECFHIYFLDCECTSHWGSMGVNGSLWFGSAAQHCIRAGQSYRTKLNPASKACRD